MAALCSHQQRRSQYNPKDRIQVSGTELAMASLSSSLLCRMVLVAAASALLMMSAGTARAGGELQYDFYNASCPGVEELVRSELKAKFAADVTLPAALLRLHFHDCFVRGCDASIMLKSHNGTSEQDSDPNSTLRGHRGHQGQGRGDLPARRLLRRRHGHGSARRSLLRTFILLHALLLVLVCYRSQS
jgi:hypothetical protein